MLPATSAIILCMCFLESRILCLGFSRVEVFDSFDIMFYRGASIIIVSIASMVPAFIILISRYLLLYYDDEYRHSYSLIYFFRWRIFSRVSRLDFRRATAAFGSTLFFLSISLMNTPCLINTEPLPPVTTAYAMVLWRRRRSTAHCDSAHAAAPCTPPSYQFPPAISQRSIPALGHDYWFSVFEPLSLFKLRYRHADSAFAARWY